MHIMRILKFLSLLIILFIFSCDTDKNKPAAIKKIGIEKANDPAKKTTKAKSKKTKSKMAKQSKVAVSTKLSETVNISKINYSLIESRLLIKINKERVRLGLPKFTVNRNLYKAAIMHNNYLVKVGYLDHNQSGTSTPTMRDRVTKAGGKFRTAGENIQYEGFTIRTTNGVESIIAPTYEELAEQLWQNWRTSPPHYKNIINPDYIYLGTALRWSDKKTAVFATQVYGG